MTLRLSVTVSLRRSSEIPTPLETLPPGVIWAQALHDYQSPERFDPILGRSVPDPVSAHYYRADLGYPVPRSLSNPRDRLNDAKGFPEMVPGDPRVGVKLDKNLQWFCFKLLVWSKLGIELRETETETFEEHYKRLLQERRISREMDQFLKNAWRGLTKSFTAFTNQHGTDNRTDYINGIIRREDGKIALPTLWENTTGGSLLRLESLREYRQGYRILALKTSDFHTWKNWTPASHPGYFSDATNTTPYGFDGKVTLRGPWKVDRFHYLGNNLPVYVPILAAAGYFHIRKNRLRILKQGEAFPPRATNP